MPIQTLLFDFGAVIYDIDLRRTQAAFAELMRRPDGTTVLFTHNEQDEIFTLIETGEISPDEFRQGVRRFYGFEAADDEIDRAWNALLIGLFPGRKELVARLAKDYRVALLSNTNQIHYDYFAPETQPVFDEMERVFLSFEMKTRKPRPDIYERALQELNAAPETVLFIDDVQKNIEAAQALGIQTLHLTQPLLLEQLLAERLGR